MKPTGPIPPEFGVAGGRLIVGGRPATDWIAGRDTPSFLYDMAIIRRNVALLRTVLPAGVAIHYAMKANPHPPLVAAMAGLVDGIDVASAGELALAMGRGARAAAISFAGPGKRDAELAAAIRAGATINVESERETDRSFYIASSLGQTPRLALRVNPPFDLRGSGMRMGGGARQFGVDAERVPALVRDRKSVV